MKRLKYICPFTGEKLKFDGQRYISESRKIFQLKKNIPRFCVEDNYSESFGFQWNLFDNIQLDSNTDTDYSSSRFWNETDWDPIKLEKLNILEVGCGAGRFTEVFLRETSGILYSIDYSKAVEANYRNNICYKDRLILSQASIYQIPFSDKSFDKIFCLGVLQHTPSFSKSVLSLINKLKTNGEIVIDFYPSKGFITRLHSKYLLRPITKRLPKKVLLLFIEKTIGFSLFFFDLLCFLKLSFLTRFLPITDIRGFPENLDKLQRKKWAILDTFDAFSPEYDNPQKIKNVVKIFRNANCEIKFAGVVKYNGGSASVIRAIKN